MRPLALSPNRRQLFALNTPDGRLETFHVTSQGLRHRGSVSVGVEPVALAVRSEHEVWVINHLSDSVSIVRVDGSGAGRVVRTLLVGDEPRDIVFGGQHGRYAFITTAHRGQNIPHDPQLLTPGVGRADVWVFDADDIDSSLGGTPTTILSLFTDTPRALAVTPDGTRVYAAGFHSGNRTTTLTEGLVPNGDEASGGVPGPSTNVEGVQRPVTGLILQFNGTDWVDELGRPWVDKVKFALPDKDVFVIDAMANPPVQLPEGAGFYAGVGTILFNMAVNPVSGKVYVSNTEANNLHSFEGPGLLAGRSIRGHLHESRITVLGPGGAVTPRHLNKHINYSVCCAPIPNPENARSLAFPQEMAVSPDGATLYVAALGSSKIGVFSTAELENNTFVPDAASHISVSGGGPTGLVLDQAKHRLYTLTHFDNSISVINTVTRAEVAHVPMYSPEPESVVEGRRFLYDAAQTSSHGDSACASCHIFGDFDSLSWNLGNPDDVFLNNPGPFLNDIPIDPDFHPIKGPMSTQSLRGMANHGPMHWRGDRTGGNDEASVQPDGGSFSEERAFEKFNAAFVDLLGRDRELDEEEMQAFADFILQVTYPPNPVRHLDQSFTAQQQAGHDFFFGPPSDTGRNCNACHTNDPDVNPGVAAPGLFGSTGTYAFDFQPQILKVPHLRNAYQKVGMFGLGPTPLILSGDFGFQGDQVRGFGYTHDGSIDSLPRFFAAMGFDRNPDNQTGIPVGPDGDAQRDEISAFVLAFDTNLAPVVGQQVTLTCASGADSQARVTLLMERAEMGECDLVAKTQGANRNLGFLYIGGGEFLPDRQHRASITDAQLRQRADQPNHEVTYTCVPPGSGERVAIDRNEDGVLDGDE